MSEHKYILGDSRAMKELPDESVNLVVTSPPYWNLKDYEGGSEEIGQGSSSYEEYLQGLFESFVSAYVP